MKGTWTEQHSLWTNDDTNEVVENAVRHAVATALTDKQRQAAAQCHHDRA